MNRPGTIDIHTAQNCLVSIMAAHYVKRTTGNGHDIQTSLLGVSAFPQGERLIGADGSLTETTHLTSDQCHYHRIFECADGEWIAIAAHRVVEQAAVRAVLGEAPENFSATAKSRPAAALLCAFEAAGVNRFYDNPLNRELGLIAIITQPL